MAACGLVTDTITYTTQFQNYHLFRICYSICRQKKTKKIIINSLSQKYFLICAVNINSLACKTQRVADEYAIMNINEFYHWSCIKTNDSRQANLFQTPTPGTPSTVWNNQILISIDDFKLAITDIDRRYKKWRFVKSLNCLNSISFCNLIVNLFQLAHCLKASY